MTTQYAIEGNNITKNLKGFNLDIDDLKVPKIGRASCRERV